MMTSLAKRSMSDPSSWGSTGASIQEKPACSSAVETTENTERSSLTRRGHNSLGQIRACQFRGQPITGEVAKADQRLSVSENDRCVVDAAPKIWRGVFKGDQNVNVWGHDERELSRPAAVALENRVGDVIDFFCVRAQTPSEILGTTHENLKRAQKPSHIASV